MIPSVRIENSVELINITPVNPLISQCEIKVLYVSDEPNRNNSVITKEAAKKIANSLPGCPLVGCWNEKKKDFEGHERLLEIKDGKVSFADGTRPYGFVDLHAKVWFEKFLEQGVEREYLMTTGYIWTGQYPEAQRIIDKGNNQSMELDEKNIDAYWAKGDKKRPQFFIINEAVISKLCILGEDTEPCFEGAQITKLEFSLGDSFKEQLFSLMNEMKKILDEGGAPIVDTEVMNEEVVVTEEVAEEVEPIEEAAPVEETEPAVTYNLDEVTEYVELKAAYDQLVAQYAELNDKLTQALEDNASLLAFKADIEKKEKLAMINSFYMLSDADKAEVIENIDNYSLADIEAKLSIICVRKKVNFSLDDDNTEPAGPITYSLNDYSVDEAVPAWVKALQETAKNMN